MVRWNRTKGVTPDGIPHYGWTRRGWFVASERIGRYYFPMKFTWWIVDATIYPTKEAARAAIKRYDLTDALIEPVE